MRRIFALLFFVLPTFVGVPTLASEIFEQYNGTRSLGMGGVGIAIVNDETALLVNPAGLGKLRDSFGTFLDPELEVTSAFQKFYTAKAFTDPTNIEKVAPAAELLQDRYYFAKFQLMPSYVVRNFGIALFHRKELALYYDSSTGLMPTHYVNDQGLLLGYNFRFWEGRIKIGFTGKLLYRIEVEKDLDTTASMALGDIASEGAGIGADAGIILTAPWDVLPTLAVRARDVGSTTFENGSGYIITSDTRPVKEEQKVDVAVAIFPIHTPNVRSTFSIEMRDVMRTQTETAVNRRTHVGYEMNLHDLVFFRLGMNQNYYTGGIEFASERTQLQFASYAEEVGTSAAPQTDRRYVWKWAFRF